MVFFPSLVNSELLLRFYFYLYVFRNRDLFALPFAPPPPGDEQVCQSIPAGPIVPRSIDTSNGIGGVPVQRVRAQRPADHTLHLHILSHRLRRLAEAVSVSWALPEVELGGFLQDGGEKLVRKGVDCR